MSEPSRRKRLDEYVNSGRLRDHLNCDEAVAQLIVDLCLRYTEPRRPARWKRIAKLNHSDLEGAE